MARINLWTYQLPALKDRKEDIPANIDYEISLFERKSGQRIQFNREAKIAFEKFAMSPSALWTGNFRDLSSAITRLCTLADSSRITVTDVQGEVKRLTSTWSAPYTNEREAQIHKFLTAEQCESIDDFDLNQLNYVLHVCAQHASMASAGRALYNVSRTKKSSPNDSTRLQKYLHKFSLSWSQLKQL